MPTYCALAGVQFLSTQSDQFISITVVPIAANTACFMLATSSDENNISILPRQPDQHGTLCVLVQTKDRHKISILLDPLKLSFIT